MTRQCFCRDEHGLVLTEYLVLLGLLSGMVVISVFTFGDKLGLSWQSWTGFYQELSDVVSFGGSASDAGGEAGPATRIATAPAQDGRIPCQNGIDHGSAERSRCGGRK